MTKKTWLIVVALANVMMVEAQAQPTLSLLADGVPHPSGIAVSANGDVYFAVRPDVGEPSGLIQRRNPDGTMTTVAGGGQYLGDGIPATSAAIVSPAKIGFDLSGGLVYGEAARIRRIDLTTGTVSTIAGIGSTGYGGDGGPAVLARLDHPAGFSFDANGSLYIADTNNRRLRRVDAQTGIITTIAGDGYDSYAGALGTPVDVAVVGPDIYVAVPNRFQVLHLASDGSVTPVAGNGSNFANPNQFVFGYTGDGGPASLATICSPQNVAIDANGNVFFGDSSCPSVRRVDNETGIVQTLAYSPLTGLLSTTDLGKISAMAIYKNTIYVADSAGRAWSISPLEPAELPGTPEPLGVLNSATFLPGFLAPGAVFSIVGNYLSSPSPSSLQIGSNGRVTSELAGVQVFLNGIAAPLLYASPGQINAIVPYASVEGPASIVVQTAGGQAAVSVESNLGLASPEIFAVVNPDGTINGVTNPAPQGATLVLFGAGMGSTNPAEADGFIYAGGNLPAPVGPTAAVVQTGSNTNIPATVAYLGQAPSSVAGIMQANIVLPPGLPGSSTLLLSIYGQPAYSNIFVQSMNAPPAITSLVSYLPNSPPIEATVGDQPVLIEGSGFQSGLAIEVFYKGISIGTVNSPIINSSLININLNFGGNAGVYGVQAINPSGQRSAIYTFTVASVSIAPPVVNSVGNSAGQSNQGFYATASDQNIVIGGSGFLPGLTVQIFYNGGLATQVTGSAAQLDTFGAVGFEYNFADRAGTYAVQVINPDGQASGLFDFDVVLAPAPVITSISPSSGIVASAQPQTLNIYGNIFLPGVSAELFYNGEPLEPVIPYNVTRFGNYSIFFVTVNFNRQAGTYALQATNPDGQTSPLFTFAVQP